MTQLTEERFEQILTQKLDGLVTKQDAALTEKRIIKRIDEAQEELARMTARL